MLDPRTQVNGILIFRKTPLNGAYQIKSSQPELVKLIMFWSSGDRETEHGEPLLRKRRKMRGKRKRMEYDRVLEIKNMKKVNVYDMIVKFLYLH